MAGGEDGNLESDEVTINDPMYLIAAPTMPAPFNKEPMFKDVFSVPVTVEVNDKTYQVQTRYSVAKDITLDLAGTVNRGDTAYGKDAANNIGVSVMLEGIDQPVAPLLKADLPANPDPRLSRITIGHLLSMQSGLQRTSGQYYGAWVTSPNWVRYALSRPFVEEPGGVMLYSTGNSHLLSAILTRTTGRGTDVLAREWLGAPLDIQIPSWARDPQGIAFGGNDMLMSPRALARFGELYRNDGRIDGRQILSKTWIADSWRPRGVSPWSGNGYGFGWFASEVAGDRVHFAWGYGGQMLYIVPSLNLTVVMTSDSAPHPRAESHIAELHALLADYIVPAARKGKRAENPKDYRT